MDCIFYTFSKRPNSTALPGDGVKLDIQLKAPTDIIGPKISISMPNGSPIAYNYCNIPQFGRMYFIRNWTYNAGGVWVASLSEDVLASWKEQIGNATEYVLRSAATYDGNLIDAAYPALAGAGNIVSVGDSQWVNTVQGGTFVLAAIGSGVNGFGATSFYSMSNTEFRSLCSALLSNVEYLNISADEISENLSKALFNPYQYLVSAMWFPAGSAFQNPGLVTSSISVGWWDLSIRGSAYFIDDNSNSSVVTMSFNVPKHPQSAERGAWLNASNYSEYTLYIPPFGEISIDGNLIDGAGTIYAQTRIDAYTGAGLLFVSTDNPGSGQAQNIIATRSAQVGVPVSLAQIAYQPVDSVGEIISSGITALAGAVEGFLSGGKNQTPEEAATNALSGAGDAMQHRFSEGKYKGSCGTVAVYDTVPYLQLHYMTLVPDDNTHRGRPLCQKRQISSLPGFLMIADPDISLPATQAELDAIRGYMSSGFFFE